jgi:hypothetical protein
MEDLCRVRRSLVGGGFGEVVARSMRRTEAPLSARRRPAKGPGLGVLVMLSRGGGGSYLVPGRRIRGLGDLLMVVEMAL